MKREAKILIVDDSKAILGMMENILSSYGLLDVAKAGNGLQAVELFQTALQQGTTFSPVFLDIVMPVMDGQETLRRIRAMEREAGITGDARAVIIMVTSLHSTSDMMTALIDGDCSDYLVKPFEAEDLRAMLVKYGFLDGTEGESEQKGEIP